MKQGLRSHLATSSVHGKRFHPFTFHSPPLVSANYQHLLLGLELAGCNQADRLMPVAASLSMTARSPGSVSLHHRRKEVLANSTAAQANPSQVALTISTLPPQLTVRCATACGLSRILPAEQKCWPHNFPMVTAGRVTAGASSLPYFTFRLTHTLIWK